MDGAHSFHTFFGLDYSPNQRVFFLYFVILAFALVTNFFTAAYPQAADRPGLGSLARG